MFDNLREQANSVPFYEEEERFHEAEGILPAKRKASSGGHFLGMTPFQRFIIAVLILISLCALGSMCLMITGRIGMV